MTDPTDEPRDGDAPEPPPLGATAEAAIAALFDAGPEAAEHLLKAAQELLLAAKAVVDAAPAAARREDAPAAGGGVRRIDLA